MPDFASDAVSGDEFEASVRHVARQLYAESAHTGSVILDGRERDEVIDTGTELIIIEATKKRTLDKVKYDLKKSADLVRKLKKDASFSEYNFRILLITRDDPTADQNAHVRSSRTGCPREIISFSALFSRLFDARHYIRIRRDHSFGSIRNPADDTDLDVPPSSYIPTALSESGTGVTLDAKGLANAMESGGRYLVLGDYGSGKSMTLRDVYLRLKEKFALGELSKCPVYINLREHVAQVEPHEALIRHAGRIGFEGLNSLVAAWRAGYVVPILDGFDELTPPQFTVSINNLRQARRFAVELVKNFVRETPNSSAVLIAGRESYFDQRSEAMEALGLTPDARIFDLSGFTDKDIEKYLRRSGDNVPAWLPSRPLLLGYIANSGLLTDDTLMSLNPAAGWDLLLTRICEREIEQIWGPGFEPTALRQFIEGLASRSRKSEGGASLSLTDLRQVFHSVFGQDADEPADLLTSRLPGLGSVPGKPGSKAFVDDAFADAAASGQVSQYLETPFNDHLHLMNLEKSLGILGKEMVFWHLGGETGSLQLAIQQSAKDPKYSRLTCDLFSVMNENSISYTGDVLIISDGYFDHLEVDANQDFSNIKFRECLIRKLELGRSDLKHEEKSFPKFKRCVIERVIGAMSASDLPKRLFSGTSIEDFSEFAATNEAVIKSNLPEPTKVLLTILRKLFIQRGSGRLISALHRGLPQRSTKFVMPIIDALISRGFSEIITLDRRNILLPNRSKAADALSIINAPNMSKEEILSDVKKMQ